MRCPKCQHDAPDKNYKCPQCGEILKPDFRPNQSLYPSKGKKPPLLTYSLLLVIFAGLLVIGYLIINREAPSATGTSHTYSNRRGFKPGERTDITQLIQPGKVNIFDFYSDFCGPCKNISPRLQKLDEMREDIVVVKMDINRSNIRGIDWNSPLARQYNLSSIPYFIVFDSHGNQTHEGSAAWRLVYQLLKEAHL